MKINSRWNNNSKEVKRKLQHGLSLIEAAMVLALSAVVVAGVMAYYQSASTNEKVEKTIGEIMAIVSSVNSIYSSAPDFSGLDSDTVAKEGGLPASFIDNKSVPGTPLVKSPFGFTFNVAYGTPSDPKNKQYYMLSLAVPRSVCASLVRLDLGSSLVGISLAGGGSDNKDMVPVPIPVSVEQSQQLCGKVPEMKDPDLAGHDFVYVAYTLH